MVVTYFQLRGKHHVRREIVIRVFDPHGMREGHNFTVNHRRIHVELSQYFTSYLTCRSSVVIHPHLPLVLGFIAYNLPAKYFLQRICVYIDRIITVHIDRKEFRADLISVTSGGITNRCRSLILARNDPASIHWRSTEFFEHQQ